ncbi:hypothetical protein HCN44_009984 [Aphidius gifuensis]|uniref:Uncharacterized protein n=1 Tax=Aphidius gifuensis TaxID=684658 RepID=A0A834XYU8_APHGI|nr:hypothetical protein HCN44_009984 [Aphidius gifuensis]
MEPEALTNATGQLDNSPVNVQNDVMQGCSENKGLNVEILFDVTSPIRWNESNSFFDVHTFLTNYHESSLCDAVLMANTSESFFHHAHDSQVPKVDRLTLSILEKLTSAERYKSFCRTVVQIPGDKDNKCAYVSQVGILLAEHLNKKNPGKDIFKDFFPHDVWYALDNELDPHAVSDLSEENNVLVELHTGKPKK